MYVKAAQKPHVHKKVNKRKLSNLPIIPKMFKGLKRLLNLRQRSGDNFIIWHIKAPWHNKRHIAWPSEDIILGKL